MKIVRFRSKSVFRSREEFPASPNEDDALPFKFRSKGCGDGNLIVHSDTRSFKELTAIVTRWRVGGSATERAEQIEAKGVRKRTPAALKTSAAAHGSTT